MFHIHNECLKEMHGEMEAHHKRQFRDGAPRPRERLCDYHGTHPHSNRLGPEAQSAKWRRKLPKAIGLPTPLYRWISVNINGISCLHREYLKSNEILKYNMDAVEGGKIASNIKASRFYYRHREEILERRREKRKEDPEYMERQRVREETREETRRRKEAEAMEKARLKEVAKEERRLKREEEKAAKREEEKAAKREEKARRVGAA